MYAMPRSTCGQRALLVAVLATRANLQTCPLLQTQLMPKSDRLRCAPLYTSQCLSDLCKCRCKG